MALARPCYSFDCAGRVVRQPHTVYSLTDLMDEYVTLAEADYIWCPQSRLAITASGRERPI
jgi:hypothetical protein